jgi:acetyltransferase
MQDHSLDKLFSPSAVAVIGASERPGSAGYAIVANLLASFKGNIYPVNPKHDSILGQRCYPSIGQTPGHVDLAVIATPAATVPEIVASCVQAGVDGAIIISAGFKEAGPEGIELEERVLFHARGKMRIIGPNCLGVMRPSVGLNATFAPSNVTAGSIAFLSQSGAFCTAILDWSHRKKIGFSAIVSIGSMADIDWSDLIRYFAKDLATRSIFIYMESLGDVHEFVAATRKISYQKPIILLKAGRTAEAVQAAVSHTGSLAGNDDLFSAAMRQCHVLRADTIEDLFHFVDFLAKQPLPRGPNLTIVTNAGGPGIVTTDALVGAGGKLAVFNESSNRSFESILGTHAHFNPVDVLGDATPEKYAKAVQIAVQDPGSDATLVILTPQSMTDPSRTADYMQPWANSGKPFITSWMGDRSVQEGRKKLDHFQIPCFNYPDAAAQTFSRLWRYCSEPAADSCTFCTQKRGESQQAEAVIQQALREQRVILNESESKNIIHSYGIRTVQTEIATDAKMAAYWAEKIGFPVVLKVFSRTITHKAKVGGVKLDLNDAQSVLDAFEAIFRSVKQQVGESHFQGVTVQPMVSLKGCELLLGAMTDEQFGPAVLFGFGGSLVEVMNDRAIGFPPLSHSSALHLIGQTKVSRALNPENMNLLANAMVQFSLMIIENPQILECDINPLIALENEIIALDARILLTSKNERPRLAFGSE